MKSKGFIIYFVIGLFVYIVPFMFGLTSFVRYYLEDKTVFSDYIDKIEQVYINDDQDVAMCVIGSTRGKENIEYWLYIPYSHYNYTKEIFHHERVTNLSAVNHDLIQIATCDEIPYVKKGFNRYSLPVKYVLKLPESKDRLSTEMFDVNQIKVSENTIFVEQNINGSQLAFIRFVENNKKIGVLFHMHNVHYPEELNPLWEILYIPAFLLDVLLWPIYLVLILFTPMKA